MRLHPLPAVATAAALLAACGGGTLENPAGISGDRLSFVYYQQCIEPILQDQLAVNIGGNISQNSCAGSGCHSNTSGTGGALRIVPLAAPVELDEVDLDNDANKAVVRTLDIYKNFYSSQGEVIPGNPGGSRLLNKPLVRNVLHGGGLIFEAADDANARLIAYWINRPVPAGQDEFSASAAASMFTPPVPTGTCNTE